MPKQLLLTLRKCSPLSDLKLHPRDLHTLKLQRRPSNWHPCAVLSRNKSTSTPLRQPLSMSQTTECAKKRSAKKGPQFYRRVLPETCIAFGSDEGKQIFKEALLEGHMECYFGLAAQFRTQDEPAYCGLSTLVMVLNTLQVDPKKVWKGVWRWYHENMLDCCVPLGVVAQKGITFRQFACLAACNNLRVETERGGGTETAFRAAVQRYTRLAHTVIVASYSRQDLSQTGDGHFSPIAGYHKERDLVLILDTARFKYPPHWVPLPMLHAAMKRHDPDTDEPRGYFVLSKSAQWPLVLFRLAAPLLPATDTTPDTTMAAFLKEWQDWYTTSASTLTTAPHSSASDNNRNLNKDPASSSDNGTPAPALDSPAGAAMVRSAVHGLVRALRHLSGTGQHLLSTQLDAGAEAGAACPDKLSDGHSCAVQELLRGLEKLPLFHVIKDEVAALRGGQREEEHSGKGREREGDSGKGRDRSKDNESKDMEKNRDKEIGIRIKQEDLRADTDTDTHKHTKAEKDTKDTNTTLDNNNNKHHADIDQQADSILAAAGLTSNRVRGCLKFGIREKCYTMVDVRAEHFVAMLLLAWPYPRGAAESPTFGHRLQMELTAELVAAAPGSTQVVGTAAGSTEVESTAAKTSTEAESTAAKTSTAAVGTAAKTSTAAEGTASKSSTAASALDSTPTLNDTAMNLDLDSTYASSSASQVLQNEVAQLRQQLELVLEYGSACVHCSMTSGGCLMGDTDSREEASA